MRTSFLEDGAKATTWSVALHQRSAARVISRLVVVGTLLTSLTACEANRSTRPPATNILPFASASVSPLERSTFEAELSITTADLTGENHKATRAFDPMLVSGRVIHGTGYVDMKPFFGKTAGIPSMLQVLETRSGFRHGQKTRHGRGIGKDGHLMALDADLSEDGGPSSATRFSQDGEQLLSSTQDWKPSEDGWLLRGFTTTLFRGGVPFQRTVVKVKLLRKPVMTNGFGMLRTPSLRVAITDELAWAGRKSLEALSPTPLFAQEAPPSDTSWWREGVTKALNAIGSSLAVAGYLIEAAALTGIGLVLLAAAALWDFDVWVAGWLATQGDSGDACQVYEDALLAYPDEPYDPELSTLCGI